MMKTVLVYPRYKYPLVAGALEPLGVQYIASTLEKSGADVEIVDLTFEKDLERLKKSVRGASYVGFSFTTPLFGMASQLLKYVKEVNNNIVTIAGGPHTTIDHESALNAGFDYAVIGEGEKTMEELIKNLKLDTPHKTMGIAFKDRDRITVNERREFTADLDDIPFPARKLINYSLYDSIGMIASRGCKYNCLYCQPTLRRIFGSTVRERSIDNIAEEIETIVRRYGARRLRFEDDTFTMRDISWFDAFRGELKKRRLNIKWQCNSRVDTIDFDKARIMRESGCRQIAFGIESGSKKVLDFYRKGTSLEQAKRIFDDLKKLDIITHAFIMLGAPEETKEDLEDTYEFIKTIRPDKLSTYNVTPIPGSDLFRYCEEKKTLNISGFENYDNAVNSLKDVYPIKLKYLNESDITAVKKRIDLYIMMKMLTNLKILRVLLSEPRRFVRAARFYIRRYIAPQAVR